jgi:WD40 repeat protein
VSAVLGALDGGVVPPSMTGARAPVNPYRGLLPFDEADADLYPGRDETARRLLARVTGDPGRLVLVVGPSGSGKSSLVRAGLLPRLRAGSPPTTARWFVATLVPGAEPFEALHHALTSISTAPRTATAVEDVAAAVARAVPGRADVLLVVDQLEDLFALGDPATGRRFLHALADAVTAPGTRVRVVATLRADAYDPVLHDHRFGPLAEQATMPIGALDAAGLEAAIVNPAAHVGVHVEPALAATLVADVIDRPGALPLLQFALAEAFEHRQARVLDLAGYRRRGGVQGAVAARAEGLYQSLPAAERVRVRPLLLRLVHRTADTPPRRVRVLRGDLRPVRGGDDVDDLLDRFVRARLLTADRDVATRAPTVEIAHEALLVAWPRLRDWVADDAELLRVRTHLATSAAAWDRGGRDEDDVYRGGRLEVALDLERAHPDLLAPVERDFLAASTARRDAAALRRRRREEEQSHVNRRLRRQRLGLVALLMGLLVVGLGALGQLLRAQQATRTMATLADSATLGLVSASRDAMTTDRSLALLLAIEARRASDTPATRDHLFAALTDPHPAVVHVARAPGAEIYTGLAAEGELVVAKRADGTLDVLDLPERAFRNRPVASPPLPARGVAVQPGGTIVAAAGFPGDDGVAVVVVDLATGQVLDTVRGPPGTPHEVAFSPDGRDLAIADPDGGVTVRPVAGAGPAQRLDTGGAPATALAFSADGRHVVAGTTDGELLAWARATAGVVGRRDTAHDGIVTRIVVTPDGDLYSAGVDGRVAGWSLPRLTPRGEPFQLEDTAVLDLDLDPTGTTLAIGGHDAVLLWDVAHDTEPESLGASATAAGLAFTPDGELVVARPDGSLAWWRLGPVAGMGERLEPSGPGLPTVSPDGSRLAVWGLGRGVQLFDAATRDHVGALPLGEAVDFWGLAFVGDDHTLATLTCTPQTAGDRPCAGELTLWEAGAGRRLAQTTTPSVGAVLPALVAASPDGRILATGHADGRVRVWDAETLAPVADAADVDPEVLGAVNTVDVGGDGRGTLLAAANARGEVSVWDLTTPPRLLATEPVGVAARFAPDGTLWTAAEGGRTVARDPRDLEPVGVPLAGSEAPGDLALAPAGDLVAVTSTRAAVWDVPSGQRMAGPIPTLLLAAFVDDGDTLVTGAGGEVVAGTGDVVRVWPLDPAAWDRAACRSAGRNLTSDEWRVHLPGDRPYAPTCPQWPTTEG